jgi:hypothetical protein
LIAITSEYQNSSAASAAESCPDVVTACQLQPSPAKRLIQPIFAAAAEKRLQAGATLASSRAPGGAEACNVDIQLKGFVLHSRFRWLGIRTVPETLASRAQSELRSATVFFRKNRPENKPGIRARMFTLTSSTCSGTVLPHSVLRCGLHSGPVAAAQKKGS